LRAGGIAFQCGKYRITVGWLGQVIIRAELDRVGIAGLCFISCRSSSAIRAAVKIKIQRLVHDEPLDFFESARRRLVLDAGVINHRSSQH
jgi:hypothetical protein